MTEHTIKPGKLLDELVAKEVMGWRCLFLSYLVWEVGDTLVTWEDSSFGGGFKPSTDIASAWQVVKHLTSGDTFELFDLQWDHEDSRAIPKSTWFACFIPFDDKAEWCVGRADTAPHAICLAALEATK